MRITKRQLRRIIKESIHDNGEAKDALDIALLAAKAAGLTWDDVGSIVSKAGEYWDDDSSGSDPKYRTNPNYRSPDEEESDYDHGYWRPSE